MSSLFNKLKKQPKKLKEYDDFISSQIAENVIEVADNIPVPVNYYYPPHHTVYKESSNSTKTRKVYDASSKRKGLSLIDCLESDQNLLPQSLEIVLQFRANNFGNITDIKQAFLNVSIQQSDRLFSIFVVNGHPK